MLPILPALFMLFFHGVLPLDIALNDPNSHELIAVLCESNPEFDLDRSINNGSNALARASVRQMSIALVRALWSLELQPNELDLHEVVGERTNTIKACPTHSKLRQVSFLRQFPSRAGP